jgi:hypothetical protein
MYWFLRLTVKALLIILFLFLLYKFNILLSELTMYGFTSLPEYTEQDLNNLYGHKWSLKNGTMKYSDFKQIMNVKDPVSFMKINKSCAVQKKCNINDLNSIMKYSV